MMPWHWTGIFSRRKRTGIKLVFHAGAEDFGGLREDTGNLVKAGDVVFVMLDGVEGDGKGQIREAGVDAVLLVDRHLVFFKVEIGTALAEQTHQDVVGELVLVVEAGSRDGFQTDQKRFVGLVALGNGVERVIGELIVVAVVAVGGGALGRIAEIGFVLLVEKGVLGGEAVGEWFEVIGENGAGKDHEAKQSQIMAHRVCMVPDGTLVREGRVTGGQETVAAIAAEAGETPTLCSNPAKNGAASNR